jgi:hypothetical protein
VLCDRSRPGDPSHVGETLVTYVSVTDVVSFAVMYVRSPTETSLSGQRFHSEVTRSTLPQHRAVPTSQTA